jgi:hypothetical protein
MKCHCYLRKGIVYVPTFAKIENGAYQNIEPVAVVPISHAADLKRAFLETIARGNPIVPDSSPDDHPDPVVPKYAGVKTWTAFARGTSVWLLNERDGVYQIQPYKRSKPRGWEQDPTRYITLPAGTDVDGACARFVTVLQEAASNEG